MPESNFIVATFKPLDIGMFSHAAGAVVLLAGALDWDIIDKKNRPTILRARDHTIIEVPNDRSSLRFNVFKSWIHKIATHSPEFVLPMEVVDKIATTCKLTADHWRILRDLADQSVIPEPAEEPEPEPEAPHIVSREPYMAHMKGGKTYQSSASYLRVWSDGHHDWECVVCGKAFTNPRAIGGHRQSHIAAGEAVADYRDQVRKAAAGQVPTGQDENWQVHPYGPRPPGAPEPEPPTEWVAEPVEPEATPEPEPDEVEPVIDALRLAIEYLEAHRDMAGHLAFLEAENKRLRNERRALAEMLLSEDDDG